MEHDRALTKHERRVVRQQEKAREAARRARRQRARKWMPRLALVLVLVGGSAALIWYGLPGAATSEGASLNVTASDWVKGNPKAAVVVVEYLDFECEVCGSYYPGIKRLAEEFKDRVAFVTRYFPLPGHKNSLTAALAAEAAGRQGKFWEMHDTLFQNQETWGEKPAPTPEIFEAYAQKLGLNMEQFKRDVSSPAVKERVERDRAAGQRFGVQSTPTFFLNGEKIQNPKSYTDFKTVLQGAILMPPKPRK